MESWQSVDDMPYGTGNALLVHFDEETLMPDGIECSFHTKECHVRFSPLVTEGLDGFLRDEDRVDAT